jgi:hypothetical protein
VVLSVVLSSEFDILLTLIPLPTKGEVMLKSELLNAIQKEIRRHHFDTFMDEPPSIAQGGHGVMTPGCKTCRKNLFTTPEFIDHICNDALPKLIEKLSSQSSQE